MGKFVGKNSRVAKFTDAFDTPPSENKRPPALDDAKDSLGTAKGVPVPHLALSGSRLRRRLLLARVD